MYDTDALTPSATIPQRLDRLPLTWTLWRLGLVTQAGWAVVVATDAIAARPKPGSRCATSSVPNTGAAPFLLLACWLLGYSGLVYGVIGFLNLYLAQVGFSAQAVFIPGLISGLVGGAPGWSRWRRSTIRCCSRRPSLTLLACRTCPPDGRCRH